MTEPCKFETDRVAVIGLGSMGRGMAQTLLKTLSVVGADRDAAALDRLKAVGGQGAASAAEAARDAGAVLVVVVNAAQTESVLFGDGVRDHGAVGAMRPGGVVISCATMAPVDARRLAARAEAAGVHYLDAPISGGAARAASGELTVMASGSPAAFERATPVLDAIAAKVHVLGEAAGTGAAFKIVNQLLAGVHVAAACEAMTFAARLGLDLAKVYEVVTGAAGNSWMFENRAPHILAGDYRPASAVDIFVKDLGIVAGIGHAEKFPTSLTATALQMFLMTSAAGMGGDDDASVARLIAKMTGLELPSTGSETV